MLDIKEIRENRTSIEELIQRKEPGTSLDKVVSLDNEVREIKTRSEQLKASRKSESKRIGELKKKGESADALMQEMKQLGDQIQALDDQRRELEKKFIDELSRVPNIPQSDIRISLDPADNVEVKCWKKRAEFAFNPKNHLELNEKLHLFDLKRTAKTTGSGWPSYRGMAARLEWALLSYMQEIHIKNGFEPWLVPHLVNYDSMFGSGQIPKFENQMFKIKDDDYHLYLIPTAEVVLNSLHREEIIPESELPIKYIATSPCFRREAGAAGATERGLIRVHQFNKVEMFCFTHPEDSGRMFDEMLLSAEEVLQGLDLHYRNMLLVTGDMSFASTKTIDIEVWLPGQDRYYEVSSVSNCTDYQARRSNTRYRPESGGTDFVHTLNGSGLATARLMVALLENNQQEDGSVHIPEVLRKYVGGESVISPRNLVMA